MDEDWKIAAKKMFEKYVREAKDKDFVEIPELRCISAGKAAALSELLEKFGSKPIPPDTKEDK